MSAAVRRIDAPPAPAFKPVPGTPVVVIGVGRYCRPEVAAAMLGITVDAINRKIDRGVWVKGVHYRVAPDGMRYINMEAVYDWIEGGA